MAFSLEFRKDLEALLNRHSIDNECQTPDFILADMLFELLQLNVNIIAQRERWFGRDSQVIVARSVYAKCTDTKTSDGGSCSPRVPCDGILYDIETGDGDGGCSEPCTFVMHPEQYRIKD